MWQPYTTAKLMLTKSWKLTGWMSTFPFLHTEKICQYLQHSSYLKYLMEFGLQKKTSYALFLAHTRKKGKVGFRRNSTGDDF